MPFCGFGVVILGKVCYSIRVKRRTEESSNHANVHYPSRTDGLEY